MRIVVFISMLVPFETLERLEQLINAQTYTGCVTSMTIKMLTLLLFSNFLAD